MKIRLFIGLCGISLTLIACGTEEAFNECFQRTGVYIAAHTYREPQKFQDQDFMTQLMVQLKNETIDRCDKDYSLNENRVKCKEQVMQFYKDAELKRVFTNTQQYNDYEKETERQCPKAVANLKNFWKK